MQQLITLRCLSNLFPGRLVRERRCRSGGRGRRKEKFADTGDHYIFEPIAVQTLRVFNLSTRQLLNDVGRRISHNSGAVIEASFFLYQTTQ